eukprot:1182669-Prorocentrum_minimum.AAC.1
MTLDRGGKPRSTQFDRMRRAYLVNVSAELLGDDLTDLVEGLGVLCGKTEHSDNMAIRHAAARQMEKRTPTTEKKGR